MSSVAPKFTMPFEPATVDDLGLRLYSTLPPVISELVSNSYDAESTRAIVTLPVGPITPESEVIVQDFGHGLDAGEVQRHFLPIGRKRRGKHGDQTLSKNGKVRITGRKGLGKLSAFGVAAEMEVRFIRDGSAVCLRLNYDEITSWAERHGLTPYEPHFVAERSGTTKDKDGGEIRLRKLRRSRAINADEIRKGLARRLNIIGSKFHVSVNGTEPSPGDRVHRSQCVAGQSWSASELPEGGILPSGETVTGWIGFLPESSQTSRGVDIFANGKAAELGSFFGFSSTHAQWARAYFVGEIHADFLDAGEDLIATARNSVVWESPLGLAFQDWGHKALRWAFDQWVEARRVIKEKDVVTSTGFDKWLATRPPREQRVAQKIARTIIDDPEIEPKSAAPLFEIVKSSVEAVAFRDLVDSIEEKGISVGTLLQLFDEWRIIEAREHLKLADGRLEAIDQLKKYMQEGALEVQQMQPLFEQHPWLIDSAWAEVDGQTTYTQQLRERCVEPKDYEDVDRRIDILGIRYGGGLIIVELKRPEKHVVSDLQPQVAKRLAAAIPGKTWLAVEESVRPKCHRGDYKGFTNVYGRMSWDQTPVTMTSGCTTPCKGRFGHPDKTRTTISVREAATIQGFPEDYVFKTDEMEAVCRLIGNAVPPPFAEITGKQIRDTLLEINESMANRKSTTRDSIRRPNKVTADVACPQRRQQHNRNGASSAFPRARCKRLATKVSTARST